jgi:hypothetical protein
MDRPCLPRPTYRCTNPDNIHVRGYTDGGTITTPFDNTVLGAMMVAETLLVLWVGWSQRLAMPTPREGQARGSPRTSASPAKSRLG